jgi:hypothetical protein
MEPFDDDGSFCNEASPSPATLLDLCCRSPRSCVQRCCEHTSALNMSLSCCAVQTTCGGTSECSVLSGNIRSARNVAHFSSRGPTLDGRFKPDIIAPGEHVMSAFAPGQSSGDLQYPDPNHCLVPNKARPRTQREALNMALGLESGSSMAAPLVAGAVEKIRQYFLQGYYPNGAAGSSAGFEPEEALVRAVVIASCVCAMSDSESWGVWTKERPNEPSFIRFPLPPLTPNIFYGFGLPVLDRAVRMAGATNGHTMLYVTSSFYASSSAVAYNVTCSPASPVPLALVLVWTDPPGSVISSAQLVNDLDLIVLLPGDTSSQLFGNMRPFADSVNTVEKAITRCPALGFVTAIVAPGRPLSSSAQRWYLVANGPLSSINETHVPSYVSGRSSIYPATQSKSCSLETGIVVDVKFRNQLSPWTCDGVQGALACDVKILTFTMTLAQVMRVSASGISFRSSDLSGVSVTLQCSSMLQGGHVIYVTSSALLQAVRTYCNSPSSLCKTDSVLGEFDWGTLTVISPQAAGVIMRITAYNDHNCSDAPNSIGNNSAPNPFVFNDRSCAPGASFEHNQLYFKAETCASNASFESSLNVPSCSVSTQVGFAKSVQASFVQGQCIPANVFFRAVSLQSAIDALKRRSYQNVPNSFSISCRSIVAPQSTSDCINGTLCLAVSDNVFNAIMGLLLAHVVQAIVWTVFAKRREKFTVACFILVSMLPVLGLVGWLVICRSVLPSNASLIRKGALSGLLERVTNSRTPEVTRDTEFTRLTA